MTPRQRDRLRRLASSLFAVIIALLTWSLVPNTARGESLFPVRRSEADVLVRL